MIVKKDIHAFHETNRILLRENDYVYILPHPALRGQISNYTVTFPSTEIISDDYTVIPHGSATLVFSYHRYAFSGNLFGPMTKPCMVGGQANQCDMLVIIEFQPAGLSALTGENQKELADRRISFEIIHSTLNRLILDALERAGSLDELIVRLDRIFIDNLYAKCPSELQIATELLRKSAGNISCKELAASVYYSERHLGRMFQTYFGMNTKTFSRLVRINKAIRLMQNTRYPLECASCETGFYDLPHFIHDFKSVCGLTPQEYRIKMSDFYNEIAKF